MGNLDPVVCPKCQIGFAPSTLVCPVCKIALISGDERGETSTPALLADELSSLEELRTAGSEWIRHLQEKLAEVGIPYRTELSDNRDRTFTVYVRPENLARAKEVDDKVYALEVPDSEGMPRVEKLDFSSCPGCGNRLEERDRECSGCGLVLFSTDGWTCGNCDGIVEVDVVVCPHCGGEIDWSKI